jgi:hypothetical protein
MIIAVIEFVMGDDSSAATTPVILKKWNFRKFVKKYLNVLKCS